MRSSRRAAPRRSLTLLAATNRVRRQWMLQTTYRDVRVIDGVVDPEPVDAPSFFASTTILIIGGLLAVLGTTEKASELVREIPFVERTSLLMFDLKLLLLLACSSMRSSASPGACGSTRFGALLVAAAPEPEHFAAEDGTRERFADRAGRVMGLAAETFNAGCAPTTWPSPRSAGSSRRSSSSSRPRASCWCCTSASSARSMLDVLREDHRCT